MLPVCWSRWRSSAQKVHHWRWCHRQHRLFTAAHHDLCERKVPVGKVSVSVVSCISLKSEPSHRTAKRARNQREHVVRAQFYTHSLHLSSTAPLFGSSPCPASTRLAASLHRQSTCGRQQQAGVIRGQLERMPMVMAGCNSSYVVLRNNNSTTTMFTGNLTAAARRSRLYSQLLLRVTHDRGVALHGCALRACLVARVRAGLNKVAGCAVLWAECG